MCQAEGHERRDGQRAGGGRRRHPARGPRDRSLRCDRRPGAAQAPAGHLPSRRGRVDAGAFRPHRRLAQHAGGRRVRRDGAGGRRRVGPQVHYGRLLGPLRRLAPVRRARGWLRGARRGGDSRARGARRRAAPPALPVAAADGRRRYGRGARPPRPRRRSPGDHGEAVRGRPRLRPCARRAGPLGLRREPGLPDRSLPRPRGGPEPARGPLRQRHVRAGLEPLSHRPHPDRRPRDALDRDARRLLRADRCLSRHGRYAHVRGAQLRRDGAADLTARRSR